jgi:hypothetical protein
MPKRSTKEDISSLTALVELLRAVVSGIYEPDDQLCKAVRSQSSLAAYSRPDGTVVSMSLNHQKLTANAVLGGFSVLDRLRREALSSLELNQRAGAARTRTTRKDVENSLAALKRENQILREDLFLMQRAFDIRCSQARRYALAAGEPTISVCAKEQLELDRGLSVRRIVIEPSNVVQLRGKHGKR